MQAATLKSSNTFQLRKGVGLKFDSMSMLIFSKGKILKIIKRTNSQEESFLKSLRRKNPQDHQNYKEESFSRASRGKVLKILKRKDSQEDSQEEFCCTTVRWYVADFSPSLVKLGNVCFIKVRSKHSSNTLMSLLQIFMKQTLCASKCAKNSLIGEKIAQLRICPVLFSQLCYLKIVQDIYYTEQHLH